MIILPRETEALAERLAAAQHLSVEDAIRLALEDKARAAGILPEPPKRRDMSPEALAARRARTDQIVAEIAAMPVLDPRSPQEIADDLDSL
jgi:antitoxin VapB